MTGKGPAYKYGPMERPGKADEKEITREVGRKTRKKGSCGKYRWPSQEAATPLGRGVRVTLPGGLWLGSHCQEEPGLAELFSDVTKHFS